MSLDATAERILTVPNPKYFFSQHGNVLASIIQKGIKTVLHATASSCQ